MAITTSDRDPNSMDTVKAFDKSVEWVKTKSFSEQDVNEAKLAIFSDVSKDSFEYVLFLI